MTDSRIWRPGEDEIMSAAWCGLMSYLIGVPEARRAFEGDTGASPYNPPRNGLEAMIDKACGITEEDYARKFCLWATEHHWGEPMPPTIAAAFAKAGA